MCERERERYGKRDAKAKKEEKKRAKKSNPLGMAYNVNWRKTMKKTYIGSCSHFLIILELVKEKSSPNHTNGNMKVKNKINERQR